MNAEMISLTSIDLSDDKFKISKNIISAELLVSIKTSGILRPPSAVYDGKLFYLVTGHNRVAAAALAGLEEIPVVRVQDNLLDVIIREAALKSFNGEIGPSGKLAAIALLKNDFNMNDDFIQKVGCGALAIPEWVLNDAVFISEFAGLQKSVKDFFDIRDIPFKLIKTFFSLPKDAAALLGGYAAGISMGVNIFKKITELLADITRRDNNCDFLKNINMDEFNGRESAQEFLRKIFEFRYPEYSNLKKRADGHVKALMKAGISVDFPEFFEGGEMAIRIPIKRKEGAEAFFEKTQKVSKDELKNLLDML